MLKLNSANNEPCQQVSYHLIATTVTWHPDGYNLGIYLITSLSGTVNGEPISGLAPNVDPLLGNSGAVLGGWGNIEGPVPFVPGLPADFYPPLSTDLRFLIDGQQYTIGFDDMITGAMGLGGPEFGAPVSWDADVVSVPEPSSGLLFLTGLGLLGGVIFLRKV